jgi:hypothetical protein
MVVAHGKRARSDATEALERSFDWLGLQGGRKS